MTSGTPLHGATEPINSIADMRAAVFFEGLQTRNKVSRFWILLTLASIIASAGVVGESTATVIGAMIVAPLMTPILGVVLATVLGDRVALLRSWLFVIAGALAAIVVGFLVGLMVPSPVIAASNSEVASRVAPGLIALLAALATGVVGAIALVRKDISDTLPGVAIAISLVPPLAVVGLTAESGAWDESLGALLLFVTNVTAILASGVVVLIFYRVRGGEMADATETPAGRRLRPLFTIVVALVLIGVPLTATSVRVAQQTLEQNRVTNVLVPWAAEHGLELGPVSTSGAGVKVQLTGEAPFPDPAGLTAALRAAGVDPATVLIDFIASDKVVLGG